MKEIKHPNLVCLLGVCTKAVPFFIIMEYMLKGNLLNLFRSPVGQDIPMVTLVYMSQQVASAMAYLESLKVIHR